MRKFKYQTVSMAVILRDITEPKYINMEHKNLVDIADFLYNANLGPEHLINEAKATYDEYGKEFWDKVLEDAGAIDSQLNGEGTHEQELILDYSDYLSGALDPYVKEEPENCKYNPQGMAPSLEELAVDRMSH